MNRKKILITGTNGLLGQKLVSLILKEDKYQLLPTGMSSPRYLEKDQVQFVEMDITNEESVKSVFNTYQPDYCINTAAMTNVDMCETEKEGCWKLNVVAVQYLVDACKQHDTFLPHLSTDFIFNSLNKSS